MTDAADIAITAMCMWEEVLANRDRTPEMQVTFDNLGFCQVRDLILSHAKQCHDDWELFGDTFEDCFDWGWVPQWMRDNLIWDPQSIDLVSRPRPTPLHMYLGEGADAA